MNVKTGFTRVLCMTVLSGCTLTVFGNPQEVLQKKLEKPEDLEAFIEEKRETLKEALGEEVDLKMRASDQYGNEMTLVELIAVHFSDLIPALQQHPEFNPEDFAQWPTLHAEYNKIKEGVVLSEVKIKWKKIGCIQYFKAAEFLDGTK